MSDLNVRSAAGSDLGSDFNSDVRVDELTIRLKREWTDEAMSG